MQLNPCRDGYGFLDAKKVFSHWSLGMFWHVAGFPRSKPILHCHCKSLGSSLPGFSHGVPVLLSGEPKSLFPLEIIAWPRASEVNRQPFSLLPSSAFLCIKAVHAVFAINSEQMNQTVPQSAGGNKIFDWAVCKWILKLDIRFGSLMLHCQAPRQPSSRRLYYSYIQNDFIVRGFFMAVEIFEQISREQRPCWQLWITGCIAVGRGMLKPALTHTHKKRCSKLKEDVSVTLHRKEYIWLARVKNRCTWKQGFPSECKIVGRDISARKISSLHWQKWMLKVLSFVNCSKVQSCWSQGGIC